MKSIPHDDGAQSNLIFYPQRMKYTRNGSDLSMSSFGSSTLSSSTNSTNSTLGCADSSLLGNHTQDESDFPFVADNSAVSRSKRRSHRPRGCRGGRKNRKRNQQQQQRSQEITTQVIAVKPKFPNQSGREESKKQVTFSKLSSIKEKAVISPLGANRQLLGSQPLYDANKPKEAHRAAHFADTIASTTMIGNNDQHRKASSLNHNSLIEKEKDAVHQNNQNQYLDVFHSVPNGLTSAGSSTCSVDNHMLPAKPSSFIADKDATITLDPPTFDLTYSSSLDSQTYCGNYDRNGIPVSSAESTERCSIYSSIPDSKNNGSFNEVLPLKIHPNPGEGLKIIGKEPHKLSSAPEPVLKQEMTAESLSVTSSGINSSALSRIQIADRHCDSADSREKDLSLCYKGEKLLCSKPCYKDEPCSDANNNTASTNDNDRRSTTCPIKIPSISMRWNLDEEFPNNSSSSSTMFVAVAESLFVISPRSFLTGTKGHLHHAATVAW